MRTHIPGRDRIVARGGAAEPPHMRLGRYGSIVGVCLGLAATGAGIVWPIDLDIGGALFVIGIGVVVVSSIWVVVSRESS